MFIEKKYNVTPMYGVITLKERTRFNDCELFKEELWKYAILKKIKLWWGSPQQKEISKTKTLLGIQCLYKNIITGEEKLSLVHSGKLSSSDIIVKEIVLNTGEYLSKFYIAFDYEISYIKFETNLKAFIEFGNKENKEMKTVMLNKELNMIQCFIGYYNKNRILALQCKYISRNDFNIISIMDILRLRHHFNKNVKEKEKWSNKNILNKYSKDIKIIVKLCLLPDNHFFSVIKYLI